MKIEGLTVREATERKKESDGGLRVVTTYILVLKNSEGERVSISTTSKALRDMVCAQDVELELRQPQTTMGGA